MKRLAILLLAALAALAAGCYHDDTNLDYRTLDLPIVDNPENDPALFVVSHPYTLKLHDWLEITPRVVYSRMDDLSYRWLIDGELVATTKDLRWQCEIAKPRVSGIFEVHRNSAGNSEIFPFSVVLDEPITGFDLLVEEQGALRFDFLNAKSGQPYSFTHIRDAANRTFPFTGAHPRMKEYWSCETSSVVGEQILLDADPANCISFDGHTLFPTLTLQQEFVEERLPENFRLKDFLHGGYVSYLLAEDGRIFPRRSSRIYYTGRFMDLPLQYKGRQLHGERFISTKYSEDFGLIYETDRGTGRFLIVNFDYDTGDSHKAEKAGEIVEFPASAGLDGIADYELVDGWMVLNSNTFASDRRARITMLFRHKTDRKYYLREVKVKFTAATSAVQCEEVHPEVYRELPDFGPQSRICVIRTDGEGASMMPPAGYIYYTAASDPRKVLARPRVSDEAPVAFHTFDSEVVAIDHGTYTRRGCYLLFATADGQVTIYTPHAEHLDPQTNLTTFEPERVVATFQIDGDIRWAGFKYGNISSYL